MEGSQQGQGELAQPRERTATKYVVLVEHEDQEAFDGALMFFPLIKEDDDAAPQEFEGYRREDVLGELVDEGRLPASDEDGYTPRVAIIPASTWRVFRAKVSVKRHVQIED